MADFTIEYTDGETEQIRIPNKLGYEVGRRYMKAITATLRVTKTNGKSEEEILTDEGGPIYEALLNVTKEHVIEPQTSHDGDVTFASVEEVFDYYLPQLKNKKKA